MTKQEIIQILIIAAIIVFYLIFSFRYFLKLKKNMIFTGAIKNFHLTMIWIVPFVWILILMALTKSTPGSYLIEKKEDPQPFAKYREGTL